MVSFVKLSLFCGSALLLTAAATACTDSRAHYPVPEFENFTYTGQDSRYEHPNFDPATQYLNPVISGTNPDPAFCRKGEDFYMANSSFVYWPAIPIWHSRDLIDWDFVGYVIDRPSQAVFKEGIRISGGIYAPDIKYREEDETFYLIVTLVDCGGNVIFKTKDPAQGWSEPIPVPEVHGIDPSFLFDTDGRAYIVNNDEPAYPAEYSGHRAIWGREFDPVTCKVIGEAKVLIDKGIRPEEKPIWIEGPHLYHIGSKYYLMDAEGGTGDWHSEVILAGDTPFGPFKPCAQNPILTQRTQPHDRINPISCAGHADLMQVDENEWWSIFLACTTYGGDQLYNTGRSTFLLPTTWQHDPVNNCPQPLILHPDSLIPTVNAKAEWQKRVPANTGLGSLGDKRNLLTGNGTYTDDFSDNELYPLWITLRTPLDSVPFYSLADGRLQLRPGNSRLSQKGQPHALFRWTKHSNYSTQTTMLYTPSADEGEGKLAGLTLFQSEVGHYVIGKRLNAAGKPEIILLKTDKEAADQILQTVEISDKENKLPLTLRAEVSDHTARFFYSFDGKQMLPLGDTQNADILTTNYAGGFTGSVVGMIAE